MSDYRKGPKVADIVYYDAVAPLRFSGTEEARANFLRWFDGYDGPIELETHELTIAVDGDVAFANMLHLDSGKHKGGIELSIWVRETVCLRRVDGRWAITHEHRRARGCGQDHLRSRGEGAAGAVRCAQGRRQVGVIETTTPTCSGVG
ncbi:YybH family protein [Nocardia caishijiensis]|uniref:YybH family protein n=1 Tax=Nocardia caishijiensis TaxID=184756 RepID=UPI000829F134|nr:nuclear transport factor 2 family protein [Nocardia caishijiensis]